MSGWEFDNTNSIISYAVSLELPAAIAPSVVLDISSKHQLFRRDLPRKQEQPMFVLPLPGQAFLQQAQISGVVFDYVNSDGSVARSLGVAGNQITYMTAAYTRWKEFLPVLERVFSDTIGLLPPHTPLAGLVLTAANRFHWVGDRSKASLATLLRKESKLFAPHVLETDEHCHSFHGYIEKCSGSIPGQCIRNVNIQTADEPNGTKFTIITLSHRLLFNQHIEKISDFLRTTSSSTAIGTHVVTELHDQNNVIFKDVIGLELIAKMPGLAT